MKIQDLNLSDVKYFLDAVEYQSLTRSSEMNAISRPAVSKAMNRLGDWVGSPLLTHEKNVFKLTRSGEDFYRNCKRAYRQMDEILTKPDSHSEKIKIGCSVSLTEAFLEPALKKLEVFEKIKINVGTSTQIRRQLKEGEIHFGLVLDAVNDPDVTQEVIYSGNFVFASNNGQFANLLITTEDRPEVLAAKRLLKRKKLEMSQEIQVESWNIVAQLARSLGAVCILPEFFVRAPLKVVSNSNLKESFKVFLIHKGAHLLNHGENKLADLIRASTKK